MRIHPMHQIAVMLRCLTHQSEVFGIPAVEFGWSVESAANLAELRKMSRSGYLVAVFFDAETLCLPWDRALKSVREVAPAALPVVCRKFSDTVSWPDLVEAGAFHAVSLPLDPIEVRHSLGFVWAATLRRSCNIIALDKRNCA
jgi:hypothetical protein